MTSDAPAPERLAILAGGGSLPQQLADHLTAKGRPPLVLAFHGETENLRIREANLHWMNVGAVGQIIKLLKKAGVHDVVLVGSFRRPDFKNLKLDIAGAALLPKMLKAATVGDDAMLRVIVDYLEKQGLQVHAVEAVLSDLRTTAGTCTQSQPNKADLQDIQRGIEVVKSLGRLDIGQAAVIRRGQVLAVEAAEGTDQMLIRCRDFAGATPAGTLIKCAKPQQDRRVDLPTIGPQTIENVIRAGLRGIAVETDAALIAERTTTIARADKNGLFIHAFDAESEWPSD